MNARTSRATLACALVLLVVLMGCGYSRILRDRLPLPQRVDDIPDGVRFLYEAPQARNVNLCGTLGSMLHGA